MRAYNHTKEHRDSREGSPFLLDLRQGTKELKDAAAARPLKLAGPDFLKFKKQRSWKKIGRVIAARFSRPKGWKKLRRRAQKAIANEQAKLAYFARLVPTLIEDRGTHRLKDIEPRLGGYSKLYHSLLFLSALIIVILPFKLIAQSDAGIDRIKSNIISRAKEGVGSLAAAYQSATGLDLTGARHDFSQAGQSFLAAKDQISDFHQILLKLASLSGNQDLKVAAQGRDFLEIASLSAALGENASLMASALFDTPGSLSDKLETATRYAAAGATQIGEIESLMEKVDEGVLPAEYAGKFLEIKAQASVIRSGLESFAVEAEKIGDLLGADMDRRYLLVFQNNSEMRGAGGFAGSFALVDVSEGKIRNIEVPAGGSYDTEAGMLDFIQAPAPLRLLNARWFFWDANWWPDWPTSAQNMMYMYEKSSGPSVDGVIAVTPSLIERLLAALGPIILEDGTVIGSDNFWQYLQVTVEQDNIREKHPDLVADVPSIEENQPKKIIGELASKMIEELPARINQDNLIPVIQAIEDSLEGKDLMLYFSDSDLQSKVSAYNWGGAMRQAPQDYLLVAHTNIGGQKTDRVMEEKISHQASIDASGGIIDTVTIVRKHEGIKGDAFTGVRNVDWLRVYVPAGSQLISASGFSQPDSALFEQPEAGWQQLPALANEDAAIELPSGVKSYQENGFQVFADWVMTDPGEESVIRLSYRLPFLVSDRRSNMSLKEEILSAIGFAPDDFHSYSLLWQKQPGISPACISQAVQVPSNLEIRWQYPDITGVCQPASGDRAFAIIFN